MIVLPINLLFMTHVVMSSSLTKLTYLFITLSLLLWLVSNYMSSTCDPIETMNEKKASPGPDPLRKHLKTAGDTPLFNKERREEGID